MKKLLIVLFCLLIFAPSNFHAQRRYQTTPADVYRMYMQRANQQRQRAYEQRQRAYAQRQQMYAQRQRQMRESQQRVRTAMMYRQPYRVTPFEGGGGRGFGGGPVRSAPRTITPRSDYNYRGRYEVDSRKQQYDPIRKGGIEGGGNKLRERAEQAEKARLQRDSYRRQNERYMDRMATRAGQNMQSQRLTDRMGLGKLGPNISKKDVQRMKDSFGIRDLGSGNTRTAPQRSNPQRSAPQRSSPQRRDSTDRSRSDNSSRSGGGSSNRSESKDWRDSQREWADRKP